MALILGEKLGEDVELRLAHSAERPSGLAAIVSIILYCATISYKHPTSQWPKPTAGILEVIFDIRCSRCMLD